jgi:tight adherence protein B
MSPLLLLAAVAGLLMLFGAGIALLAGGRGQVDERLDQFVVSDSALIARDERAKSKRRQGDVADRLDRAMSGRGFSEGIRARIAKADAKLRVSEFLALSLLSGLALAFIFYLVFDESIILAIPGGILGIFLPRMYLTVASRRRLRTFENQLSDTLNLWVNALRSGYSVMQAMEAIATELPAPVSVEFERVVQEVRLGLSVPQALSNMMRRMPSEDLDLVVTAVNINREVGGNLAEVLDTISFTIRERVRIKGEIRTLTAQGRLSGWTISLLPFALAAILTTINREYMSALWIREDPMILSIIPCGWVVIGVGLIMMLAGIIIVQRIVDIEV